MTPPRLATIRKRMMSLRNGNNQNPRDLSPVLWCALPVNEHTNTLRLTYLWLSRHQVIRMLVASFHPLLGNPKAGCWGSHYSILIWLINIDRASTCLCFSGNIRHYYSFACPAVQKRTKKEVYTKQRRRV